MMMEMHEETVGMHREVNGRFDALEKRMDDRFGGIEGELEIINRRLDRIDTRLAALELAVFGASDGSGRITEEAMLERLTRLEQVVFKTA